jgi:hypothetical protein
MQGQDMGDVPCGLRQIAPHDALEPAVSRIGAVDLCTVIAFPFFGGGIPPFDPIGPRHAVAVYEPPSPADIRCRD